MKIYPAIKNEQKQKLGIIIKAWRIEKGITQDKLLNNNHIKICSRTTLSFIENGKVIKDDMIYYSLLERIGENYIPDSMFESKVKKIMDQLTEAMLTYNSDLILNLKNTLVELNKYQENFLYKNYYYLMKYGLELIEGKVEFSYQSYHHLVLVNKLFMNKARIVWLNVMFSYAFGTLESLSEMKLFENDLNECSDNPLIKINLYRYYIELRRYDLLTLLEKDIYFILETDNLYNLYIKFESLKLRASELIFNYEKKNQVNQFLNYIKINKALINEVCVTQSMMNLAMSLYSSMREYIEAKKLFETLMDIDKENYEFYLLFWIDCNERLELEIDLKYLCEINTIKNNQYLKYFCLKYLEKESVNTLIDYIMTEIYTSLINVKSAKIAAIFAYQLNIFFKAELSRRYKDYFEFCNLIYNN